MKQLKIKYSVWSINKKIQSIIKFWYFSLLCGCHTFSLSTYYYIFYFLYCCINQGWSFVLYSCMDPYWFKIHSASYFNSNTSTQCHDHSATFKWHKLQYINSVFILAQSTNFSPTWCQYIVNILSTLQQDSYNILSRCTQYIVNKYATSNQYNANINAIICQVGTTKYKIYFRSWWKM